MSSGLARPDFFDWFEEARRLMGRFEHQVGIVLFGGNDVQGLYVARGRWIRWHEPTWAQEYARRVGYFAELMSAGGQRLYWVGMPIVRSERFRRRIDRVNSVYRTVMEGRPNARFLDTWGVLADGSGGYTDHLRLPSPGGTHKIRVRAEDGIHLTTAGARILSAHLEGLIAADVAGPGR
jgi:hypothetical protein